MDPASPLAWFLSRVEAHVLTPTAIRDHAKLGLVLAIVLILEIVMRKNWRMRYGSRSFRIDVVYYVFYYSGLYHILVFAWMYKAVMGFALAHAPWVQMKLLADMPVVLQIAVVVLANDFLGYWIHRLSHGSRYLWAFHSIHHSQTVLTPMANYRFHIVDETIRRLPVVVPLQLLGIDVAMWLVVDFALTWILLVQHSEWNWSYGRAGRIFVSPMFHRMHHSTDERLQNRNFGVLFSFWDDLFGTAERRAPCPTQYGLSGSPIQESIGDQLVYPFVKIARDFRR